MVFAVHAIKDAMPTYDAVVVGSGYGGGVAASRLARMGFRVAVLEQGRHWRPGDFPTTNRARRRTTRLTGRMPDLGNATGLYSLSVGHGLTVFAATGLGGGSLINAGVTLRPDFARLRRHGWPSAVLDDTLLARGYDRAERWLGVGPAPEPERFAKYAGMRTLAAAAGKTAHLPSMTISHAPGRNVAGVTQYGCSNCGDCWSGCNTGAKNTVGITYIADAADHGASVFCEARATSIAKSDRGWTVEVKDLGPGKTDRRIEAPILVLAAGTLGTVELLLRAREKGLPLSDRLGQSFSANGDDLVVANNFAAPVHAVAIGHPSQAPRGTAPVGPHSMALIDLGDEHGPVWVHDGTMLTMMAGLAPLKDMVDLKIGSAIRLLRQGIYGDDTSRTQLLYVVAQDDASGRLRLQKDRVVVDWPGYSDAPERVRAEQKVRAMVEAMGGEFDTNPFAMRTFGGNRIIAHPLGGGGMGETAAQGVVSPDGRVFDASQGAQSFHEGLYVCDGAAIPSSVGVSPLLTITALAERSMMLAAERLGRPLDVDAVPARPPRDAMM